MIRVVIFLSILFITGCDLPGDSSHDALPAGYKAEIVEAIIEIPAGTLDKFELNKKTGVIEHELKDGVPRVVQYLAYPGNYGFIPNTLLDKKDGGDGDPLDVLILGAAVERKSSIPVKLIGVLKLLDRGEQDDKLIAVTKDSPFWEVNSLNELNAMYPGVADIISTWFANYKGKGKMETEGFSGPIEAYEILSLAQDSDK